MFHIIAAHSPTYSTVQKNAMNLPKLDYSPFQCKIAKIWSEETWVFSRYFEEISQGAWRIFQWDSAGTETKIDVANPK